MLKKLALLSIIAFCSCLTMSAQVPISSGANSYRSGDKLYKVQVDYVAPGDCGPSEVWTLGQITKKSKDFFQTIVSARDTVAIFECERIQHFLVQGDTLFDKGEQSRRAYCLYSQERPIIRYPFQYGDSLSGYFMGQGRVEGVQTSRSGWGYTVADGMGMLTNGEDTIPHITRIHFFDDYWDTYDSSDSIGIRIQCDRYCWYCAGYRYPIMESVQWSTIEDGSIIQPFDSVTYLFLPVMQKDLSEDAVNDSILSEVYNADVSNFESKFSTQSLLSSFKAGLSVDGSQLDVSYTLEEHCSIDFCACDILGNILGHSHHSNQESGEWQEVITLTQRPIGNTLMVNIQCGDITITKKVYM